MITVAATYLKSLHDRAPLVLLSPQKEIYRKLKMDEPEDEMEWISTVATGCCILGEADSRMKA